MPTTYQTPDNAVTDRTDHVWFPARGRWWKCCLCGGMTKAPPPYPTPPGWTPDRVEALADADRALCPNPTGPDS